MNNLSIVSFLYNIYSQQLYKKTSCLHDLSLETYWSHTSRQKQPLCQVWILLTLIFSKWHWFNGNDKHCTPLGRGCYKNTPKTSFKDIQRCFNVIATDCCCLKLDFLLWQEIYFSMFNKNTCGSFEKILK